MWGSVVGLGVLLALNPVLLGLILLIISRPRPVQNLFACWLGSLMANIPVLLIPLMVLHLTPTLTSFSKDLATPTTAASSIVRHIQFGLGVFALAVAALLAVRFLTRQRAQVSTPGANTSTMVLDPEPPTIISRLLGRTQDATTQDRSAFRRLLGRAQGAWENGSLWVSFVIGMALWPGPPMVLFIDTAIVTSGVPIGVQVGAVIVFVVAALWVFEITLISSLVVPAKTQALLRVLHNWALAQRRKIVLTILVVGGAALTAQGLGIT